jgi:hypothetical protein
LSAVVVGFSWLYGSLIYYLCNQCLSPLRFLVWILLMVYNIMTSLYSFQTIWAAKMHWLYTFLNYNHRQCITFYCDVTLSNFAISLTTSSHMMFLWVVAIVFHSSCQGDRCDKSNVLYMSDVKYIWDSKHSVFFYRLNEYH